MPSERSTLAISRTRRPDYQVFLSHATADKWIAKTLCEKIEACGATTFRDDRDIAGGDSIPEEIRRQIKRSREIMVLLTPKSAGRQWVQLEIGAAWGWSKNIRILVIRYHVDVDRIPPVVGQKRSFDLNEVENYLAELDRRVKSEKTTRTQRGKCANLKSRMGRSRGKGPRNRGESWR